MKTPSAQRAQAHRGGSCRASGLYLCSQTVLQFCKLNVVYGVLKMVYFCLHNNNNNVPDKHTIWSQTRAFTVLWTTPTKLPTQTRTNLEVCFLLWSYWKFNTGAPYLAPTELTVGPGRLSFGWLVSRHSPKKQTKYARIVTKGRQDYVTYNI